MVTVTRTDPERWLGKHAKQIFGKSWDFGPTGLPPPPSLKVGIPKKEKKNCVYFAF